MSHVDAPLLLACLPLRFRHHTVVAAAADYFFDRRWKADTFSFLLGAIPIERTKVNRRSADLAAELLDEEWNLIIFPEGGRSQDGWAQHFHPGAAYLSSRTGRPVVPVHLDGTRHILPKGRAALRRTRTTVTFGTPLWPDAGLDTHVLRVPHRSGGGHPRRRDRDRLVDGAPAGSPWSHPPAPRTGGLDMAPVLGAFARTQRARHGRPDRVGLAPACTSRVNRRAAQRRAAPRRARRCDHGLPERRPSTASRRSARRASSS